MLLYNSFISILSFRPKSLRSKPLRQVCRNKKERFKQYTKNSILLLWCNVYC